MKMGGRVWMNGRLVPFRDAKVHVLAHALHYSTAVFEGLRCYQTPSGPAIFRLKDHVDRLFASAKMYSMRMPYSKSRIARAIAETVRASGLPECYIRPIAYHGYGTVGLSPPKKSPDVAVACWEWRAGWTGRPSGIKCMVSSWTKIGPQCQPMRAKAAANYSNAVLARAEALGRGFDEAVMLDGVGRIAECSAAHIFAVDGGILRTPPLSAGLLDGITRDSVIKITEADGGGVEEADMGRGDLYAADEVFITGTAAEIVPVTRVDGAAIGTGRPGRVARALQKSFAAAATGRDDRFLQWLHRV